MRLSSCRSPSTVSAQPTQTELAGAAAGGRDDLDVPDGEGRGRPDLQPVLARLLRDREDADVGQLLVAVL